MVTGRNKIVIKRKLRMRELTQDEIEQVGGGFGLLGVGIGAVTGVGSSYFSGGNIGQIIGSGLLGGVAGFFGGIATSSLVPTFARVVFGASSIEAGILGSHAGSRS
ncbi:MAG: hypothetical protein ACJATW_002208 [Glaciecola sp.]